VLAGLLDSVTACSRKGRTISNVPGTTIGKRRLCRWGWTPLFPLAKASAHASTSHLTISIMQDLRRKADDRNADEFYFAMEHRRTKAGVDIGRCAITVARRSLDPSVILIADVFELLTQDGGEQTWAG